MDTRFLETFLVVADCGSIAEGARRLNLTPAALSQRIKVLEQDLGYGLLTRAGRTVQPTPAGLTIIEHARSLVDKVRDLRGGTASALTGLIPDIIAELGARHPAIDYFLQPGSSVDHYHRVIAGELDAAIIVRPQFALPKSAHWLTLREEPLVLIVSDKIAPQPAHALLTHHRFIRYDRAQWGGQIVDRYLRDHRIAVQEWLELDALDAIAALVDRGLGVAIVPDWAPPWPDGLRLRKLALPGAAARHTGVLWQGAGARQPAVLAFVAACMAIRGTVPN